MKHVDKPVGDSWGLEGGSLVLRRCFDLFFFSQFTCTMIQLVLREKKKHVHVATYQCVYLFSLHGGHDICPVFFLLDTNSITILKS